MSNAHESGPPRLAAILLLVGMAVLVVSLGWITYGGRDTREVVRDMPTAEGAEQATINPLGWVRWLFWMAILMFASLLTVVVFLRWSRHYRRALLRRPARRTHYPDAWAMHQAPPIDDEQAEP